MVATRCCLDSVLIRPDPDMSRIKNDSRIRMDLEELTSKIRKI